MDSSTTPGRHTVNVPTSGLQLLDSGGRAVDETSVEPTGRGIKLVLAAGRARKANYALRRNGERFAHHQAASGSGPPVAGFAVEPDPGSLLDKHQTCALLGVKPPTLEAWRRKGTGPAYIRISPTCVRYRRGDLLDWIRARRQDA